MNRDKYLEFFDEIRRVYNSELEKLDGEYIKSSVIKIGDAVVDREYFDSEGKPFDGIWEYDVVYKVSRIIVDHGSAEFSYVLKNYFTGEESRSRREHQVRKVEPDIVYERVKRLI